MTGEVCIANIGPKQRRIRLYVGLTSVAAGLALALILVVAPLPRWARLLAALPLWSGLVGILQFREKT
ncbi:MAG: hypothetical protein RJQ04_19575 [Longimicrobiales bacterium]